MDWLGRSSMRDGAQWPLGEIRSFAPGEGAVEKPRRRPVFLHGMWRSGSTFLWSRFRTEPEAMCFYEPLHHGLAKLTPSRIARDTPEQIDANGHPALSQPYFTEFKPLIDRRGVRDYHLSLAYDRFALRPSEPHPRLERYIGGLINQADRAGRTPVLGFNRTGLRLGWIRNRFDAFNVHIERDPMAIWASYAAEAAKGNYAFFSMWLTVLEKNAAHPVFAPLVERLKLSPSILNLVNAKARRRQIVEGFSEAESYFLVYYLWLACNGHALAECDLVIDTGLTDAAHYRRRIAEQIATACGFRIDLGAMRAAPPRVVLPTSLRQQIERSAQAIFPQAALPSGPVFAPNAARARVVGSEQFVSAF